MAREPILERAVMDAVWSHGGWIAPGEVRTRLERGDSLAYTTVTTVLVRLWQKSRLERRRRGRGYEYRATETRDEFAAERMEEMLSIAGDRAVALNRFVNALTRDEQQELRELLDEG